VDEDYDESAASALMGLAGATSTSASVSTPTSQSAAADGSLSPDKRPESSLGKRPFLDEEHAKGSNQESSKRVKNGSPTQAVSPSGEETTDAPRSPVAPATENTVNGNGPSSTTESGSGPADAEAEPEASVEEEAKSNKAGSPPHEQTGASDAPLPTRESTPTESEGQPMDVDDSPSKDVASNNAIQQPPQAAGDVGDVGDAGDADDADDGKEEEEGQINEETADTSNGIAASTEQAEEAGTGTDVATSTA
jgi:hypothetical protein